MCFMGNVLKYVRNLNTDDTRSLNQGKFFSTHSKKLSKDSFSQLKFFPLHY